MANNGEEKHNGNQMGDETRSENAAGAFIGGMVVGAVAGAIAGLLVAPQDGQETRKLLKKSAEALPELTQDVVTGVQFQTNRLVKSSFKGWEQSLVRLRTAITTGLAVSKQERQRLSQTKQAPFSSNPANTDAKS